MQSFYVNYISLVIIIHQILIYLLCYTNYNNFITNILLHYYIIVYQIFIYLFYTYLIPIVLILLLPYYCIANCQTLNIYALTQYQLYQSYYYCISNTYVFTLY